MLGTPRRTPIGASVVPDGKLGAEPPRSQEPVLVVDDDVRILRGVELMLSPFVAVTSVTSAEEALSLVRDGGRFAVIVADLSMPGMNGIALLNEMRQVTPDTVRILFTGEAQLGDAVRAINEGEVFRLVLKPSPGSAILSAVQAGIRRHQLLMSERTLLQDTLQGAVQALTEVLAIAQPAAYGRAIRLQRHVADMAERLGIEPRWEVEIAALLSQAGCVYFSADLIDRWYRHQELPPADQERIDRLPETSVAMLSNIPRLDAVRDIIRRQFAPPDTAGLPDGARLLAIARDFDVLIGEGVGADRALAIMDSRVGKYDPRMLAVFRSLRSGTAPAAEIREMRLSDVQPGMIFAVDVRSPRGVLLIARGQRVTPSIREHIADQWSSDYAATIPVRVIVP